MMSKIPAEIDRLSKDELDSELLRIGIIAELDAINLYEQLASMTRDKQLKTVFLDVAKEEKAHVGEFLELLLRKDKEQVSELEQGRQEIKELLEK